VREMCRQAVPSPTMLRTRTIFGHAYASVINNSKSHTMHVSYKIHQRRPKPPDLMSHLRMSHTTHESYHVCVIHVAYVIQKSPTTTRTPSDVTPSRVARDIQKSPMTPQTHIMPHLCVLHLSTKRISLYTPLFAALTAHQT
jgi:hypothetical protein